MMTMTMLNIIKKHFHENNKNIIRVFYRKKLI